MANDKNYRAVPHTSGWAVKREGSNRALSVHKTQGDAWSETRRMARGTGGEAFLQGRDGQIKTRNTYGTDPYPPKG